MGALKNKFPFNFLVLCKVLLVLMVFPIPCTIRASAKNSLPPIKDGKSAPFYYLPVFLKYIFIRSLGLNM